MFHEFDEQQFRRAWDSVRIERRVHYSLFTFGESVLPYHLVCGAPEPRTPVSITKGEVHIKRPLIITPDNATPKFRNFFQNPEEEGVAKFLLARTVHFSNLQFENQAGKKELVSDSVEEAIDKLNQQLDAEEEDRVAILSASPELAGVAVLRYAAERVWGSGPDNIQELRERGLLP